MSTQLGPWAKRVSEGERETKVTKMGEREEKGGKLHDEDRSSAHSETATLFPFPLPCNCTYRKKRRTKKSLLTFFLFPFLSSLNIQAKDFRILVIEMKEGGEELFLRRCASLQEKAKCSSSSSSVLLYVRQAFSVLQADLPPFLLLLLRQLSRCAWQGFKMQRRPRVSHTKRSGIQGESAHCAREVP